MPKTIHVERPFTLTLDPIPGSKEHPGEAGRTVKLGAGIQTVEDAIADHWFTKAHLSNGGLGAQQYAEAQRAQADQAFVALKEATAIYFAYEIATVDAEVAANMDLSEPAHERLMKPDADDVNPADALDAHREAAEKDLQARRAAGDESKAEPDQFDAMSDDQLREFITQRDGKAPNARTGRPKLLLAARGDQGAAADIENGGEA